MRIYSVTEVLSPYSDFDRISEDRLMHAAERGTSVHRYCSAYARGVWSPTDSETEGYCQSFRRWFDSQVVRVVSVEKEYRDDRFGIIGHVDLVAEVKDRDGLTVIDYKTPLALSPTWILQVATYRHLAKAMSAGALRLRPDGGVPKMDWVKDDPKYFNLFLSALNLRRFFDGGGN